VAVGLAIWRCRGRVEDGTCQGCVAEFRNEETPCKLTFTGRDRWRGRARGWRGHWFGHLGASWTWRVV
jgi:hypothetical protein